jgi:SlyX protein
MIGAAHLPFKEPLPMTDAELSIHIEMLESRLMHQEAALEELTRILLAQEERIREQSEILKRLREHVRASSPSQLALPEEETPPPHY